MAETGEQLLLFDPAEYDKKYDWSGLPYYSNPKNDNEHLLTLQYRVKNGDKDALIPLQDKCMEIALKLINKESHRNHHIRHMSMEIRRDKAYNASLYIVTRYLKDRSFYIKDSFTAYLYLRVKHELYYVREVDRIVDFVDIRDFYKECDEQYAVTFLGGKDDREDII